jgi:ABC-2 type transport system ATP-binding protein
MTVASLEAVSKSVKVAPWGTRPILHDVSIAVGEREVVGFVGHNGAGKTTSIKILAGLIRPTTGRATLFGESPDVAAARARMGYSPESPRLPELLTAREVIRLHELITGASAGLRVLERVGLASSADVVVKAMSKGMKQRLSLALALLCEPAFLILDEPMSGLDPVGRAEVAEIIRQEHLRGASVLFSTHVLSDVGSLCDRIVVMRRGSVALDRPLRGEKTRWRISLVDGGVVPVDEASDPFAEARRLEAAGRPVSTVSRSQVDLEALVLPLLTANGAQAS